MRATLCRDVRPNAMLQCNNAPTGLERLLVVIVVVFIPVVAFVVVGRVADRRIVVVIVIVAGTGVPGRTIIRRQQGDPFDHCGGMRSFCPG